ncbi:MAG: hypothetical protein LQ346_005398 [Caloplaca aetnensis]|nr:MAG: hypothetical protein LQ346_005398 [Caloplaca aetnensis]
MASMETTLDPQLRDPAQAASQSYPSLSQASHPLNPIRLPPPPQYQAPQHQWPAADGHLYYPNRTGQHIPSLPQQDHASYNDTNPQHPDQPPSDSKRPRACEACRGLKVRCEPDPVKGTCRRCAKASRACVVTAPSRKRQKKTDSRVAELERKIDALTASLHATKAQAGSESDDESIDDRRPLPNASGQGHRDSDFTSRDDYRMTDAANTMQQQPLEASDGKTERMPHQLMMGNDKKRRMSQYPDDETPHAIRNSLPNLFSMESPGQQPNVRTSEASYVRSSQQNGTANPLPPPTTPQSVSPVHEYADVVDRKVLDAALAAEIFGHYTREMAPKMPLVVFPPGTPAGIIRKHRPTLFLAILSVASGQEHPEIQRILTREIMRAFADRVVYRGEKSLELIQALQVLTIWYWPEENRDAQSYQLIHMAAVMAIDLGLGRRAKSGREAYHALWKDNPRPKPPSQAFDTPDSRRAWLACYLLCANTAMGLRRSNLIRWSPYMDECLEYLSTSSESLPSDSILLDWVRLQRLADDLGNEISLDESADVGKSGVKTQYALKGFERQMKDWEKQASKQKASNQTLDFPGRPRSARGRGENSQARQQVLTTAHVGALTTCLTSIHGMFDTFLEMTADDIRTVPVFYFVRVAYAGVLLIKMYFAATAPESELGKVISSDDMRVGHYLGKLRELLQAGAASGKCRPARSFYLVLVMFQTWFERKKKEGTGNISQEVGSDKRAEVQPVDVGKSAGKAEYKRMQLNGDSLPARRPSVSVGAPPVGVEGMDQSRLHVLGEVALGNSSSNGQGSKQGHENWTAYPAGPMASTAGGYGAFDYGATAPPPGVGGYGTEMAGYHPGFEQAIGMTFNEGNLSYMDDYALYNMMHMPNMFENIAQ